MVGSRVNEVTKCYHPEVVSPALDEESVREVEEVIVPDRDSAGFIRGEGGVAVSSLKFNPFPDTEISLQDACIFAKWDAFFLDVSQTAVTAVRPTAIGL